MPEVKDNGDSYEVEFDVQEVDGLSTERVRAEFGDHDDAHLFCELITRARSVGIVLPPK